MDKFIAKYGVKTVPHLLESIAELICPDYDGAEVLLIIAKDLEAALQDYQDQQFDKETSDNHPSQ